MSEKKELSQLGRQLLGQSAAVTLFTQEEFDQALAEAYDDFMKYAIDATKQAVIIERKACADICNDLASKEDEGKLSTALKDAAKAILNRIPEQRH